MDMKRHVLICLSYSYLCWWLGKKNEIYKDSNKITHLDNHLNEENG